MVNVLVVSAEPRLIEAVKSNLDGAQVRTASTGQEAQNLLFQETIRFVVLDYEVIQNTALDVIVGLDNIVQKEQGAAILLCRQATAEAVQLRDRLASITVAVDLSRGREQFEQKLKDAFDKIAKSELSDNTSDRLVRHEVDLPAPDAGSLIEFALARLLYTISQRKETGRLTLRYSTHELVFGFRKGALLKTPDYSPASELLGAFAWSHGTYEFEAAELAGVTEPVMAIIAEGCRTHIRQRAITETMTPLMRRYPVKTNLWPEREDELASYEVLVEVMNGLDGSTNWETALSALGQRVTDGFRAAYFAIQLDLTHTVQQPGLEGIAVTYSREVRRAREKVDQAAVEKTKAFKASSGSGRSELERELGVQLGRMRDMSTHEIFDVWEGCGSKVVQDRFYVLVKEHHPDVYGGNTSGNVRSLAQDIFILVKESYQRLLGSEKEQTVAPPAGAAPAVESPEQVPERERIDTPRLSEEASAPDKLDVKSRMSQMSGARKKQRHRQRLKSMQGRTASSSGESEAEEEPPELGLESASEPEPEPEADPQAERQAKLDHLLRRAHSAGHPDANPARDAWGKGFNAYKEGRNEEAFECFEKAYELDPEDGPNQTFYAYLRFLTDKTWAAEAEQLLRKALQGGNRQSAPDACLFLAHTIKAQNREDDAMVFYRRALRLNPSSREAQRAVRLAEMRDPEQKGSEAGGRFRNLFKK